MKKRCIRESRIQIKKNFYFSNSIEMTRERDRYRDASDISFARLVENYRVGWRIGGDTSRNFERSVNSTRVDSFSSSRMTNTDDGLSDAGRRREPRGRHHVCVLAPRRKRARIHARILPSTCAIISHERGRERDY